MRVRKRLLKRLSPYMLFCHAGITRGDVRDIFLPCAQTIAQPGWLQYAVGQQEGFAAREQNWHGLPARCWLQSASTSSNWARHRPR
jgi:hypothetical protein